MSPKIRRCPRCGRVLAEGEERCADCTRVAEKIAEQQAEREHQMRCTSAACTCRIKGKP